MAIILAEVEPLMASLVQQLDEKLKRYPIGEEVHLAQWKPQLKTLLEKLEEEVLATLDDPTILTAVRGHTDDGQSSRAVCQFSSTAYFAN